MPETAVVILNWNGLGYLQKFLPDVIRFSTDDDTIVCVADNGSTDGSADWIASNHTGVRIIKLGANYGFAGGYNKALSLISAKYYVLLNSDIEVTEGWLKPLKEFMERNPNVASCQPKILSFDRKEYFEHAGAGGCYIDKYGYPFCRGRIFHRTEKDTRQYDSVEDVFWSSGACMIVRSDAWEKCGGFDESFFAHMEEIDLCWRFHRAGYRVCYLPTSAVYHIGGGSLSYSSPFKTYLNFRNSLFLLYKNLPDSKLQSVLFKRKLLDGVAAIFFLAKGSFRSAWAVLKAHFDYYKSLKHLKEKRSDVKKLGETFYFAPILNKSIVFEFYVKRNKTYGSIHQENR
jgi:GT2 family glycosyltransferase